MQCLLQYFPSKNVSHIHVQKLFKTKLICKLNKMHLLANIQRNGEIEKMAGNHWSLAVILSTAWGTFQLKKYHFQSGFPIAGVCGGSDPLEIVCSPYLESSVYESMLPTSPECTTP